MFVTLGCCRVSKCHIFDTNKFWGGKSVYSEKCVIYGSTKHATKQPKVTNTAKSLKYPYNSGRKPKTLFATFSKSEWQ